MTQQNLNVIGDRDKIKQSIFNIVLNSMESVRHKGLTGCEQGTIKIAAAKVEDMVLISVCDTGVGMNEEELRRCTEPFYTTKPAGTGIGLAITHQYIEEIGGELKISSEKNQFTCVEILLPGEEKQK